MKYTCMCMYYIHFMYIQTGIYCSTIKQRIQFLVEAITLLSSFVRHCHLHHSIETTRVELMIQANVLTAVVWRLTCVSIL